MGMAGAEADAAAAREAGDISMWDDVKALPKRVVERFREAREDREDIKTYKKAIAEFEADPRTYTLDEVEEMIGLKEE